MQQQSLKVEAVWKRLGAREAEDQVIRGCKQQRLILSGLGIKIFEKKWIWVQKSKVSIC